MIGAPNDMPLDEAVTVARKAIALMLGEDPTAESPSREDFQDAYWVIAKHQSMTAHIQALASIPVK